MKCFLTLACALLLVLPASAREFFVYFGTYTGAKSKGIYVSRFDSNSGKLTAPQLAAETKSPSFLALHPNGRFLYAVGESSLVGTNQQGGVSAFAIEPHTGALALLNQQPSGGSGPCHLSVDAKAGTVLVANYGSGSVAVFPTFKNGSLDDSISSLQHTGSSVNKQRQAGPHAHCIVPDPANRFVLVCDLGTDEVFVYRIYDYQGHIVPNNPPSATITPGSGPRHLSFDPRGKFVYVVNEMSSTVTVFAYDAKRGAMSEVQTISTLPEKFESKTTCAEIAVHPSGKFVYASNRGHDSIAVFGVDGKTGKLSLVQHEPTQGKTPRHFAMDPTGGWLLAENQNSDSVVVFRVEANTGRLEANGEKVEVPSPVCAVFKPVD